ncbi:MAG: glycosyltransferase family 2 protein, partial [Candidatus Marinimicrobia bacterium]|nr:glycosyltransferase family 2 protein [Candidatus Neomarinimicrobiota bacterium]
MTTQANSNPKVTVIIPHWNGIEVLEPCLRSLQASQYDQLEIVVVDNASSDDSVAFVHREFPDIKVIENSENLGFAGGCNTGLREIKSELYLILNNDTTHDPDWIAPLVERMES